MTESFLEVYASDKKNGVKSQRNGRKTSQKYQKFCKEYTGHFLLLAKRVRCLTTLQIRLCNFLKQHKEETIKCYNTSFIMRNPDEKGIEKIVVVNILLSKFRMRLQHNFLTKRSHWD